jgi:hypothetical protein
MMLEDSKVGSKFDVEGEGWDVNKIDGKRGEGDAKVEM